MRTELKAALSSIGIGSEGDYKMRTELKAALSSIGIGFGIGLFFIGISLAAQGILGQPLGLIDFKTTIIGLIICAIGLFSFFFTIFSQEKKQ